MIAGRLTVHQLFRRFSLQLLVKVASLTSGFTFLIGILISRYLGLEHKTLSLIVLCFSFTIAGLGSSFLGPSIMNAANTRSNSPSSVVIGQIGVINNVAVFLMRLVIAWTAQAVSLSIALMIPALLLFTVPYFSKIFKPA